MKKKSLFKSKLQMVIYIILFIICISLFIIIGKTDFKKEPIEESKKITSIFDKVPEENIYSFCNATDVLEIINGRSGIVLMGFNKNIWTNYYAMYLNEVAMSLGAQKICYYDFLKDRDESNGTYETIVNKLNMYAPINDEDIQDIYAPTVLIVKNGQVIGYFDETGIRKGKVDPEIYYNENQIAQTKELFKSAIENYMG